MIDKCPICNNNCKNLRGIGEIHLYECDQCGKFKITNEAMRALKSDKFKDETAKISSYLKNRDIKELHQLTIFENTEEAKKHESSISIEEIIHNFPKNIYDRIDNVLTNISIMSNFTGEYVYLDYSSSSILYCDSYEIEAMLFMLGQMYELGYIESKSKVVNLSDEVRLTAKGWNRIAQLEKGNLDSKSCFVAMSFNSVLKDIYDNAIYKAIEDAGYNPIRVDAKEYNSKICDEIIANIRKAKFIVADATEQKNGVYFEAGFAMGLGKPVIWMCREDDINNLHFDTRQYNHIVWKDENDLREALLRRIQATIY